ncbi:MAG: hypothetical protein JOZ88_02680, partial [Hyphomicrobiales bacterium]|nr:hypothetical protein [Hyphomicrobiales bacterium]
MNPRGCLPLSLAPRGRTVTGRSIDHPSYPASRSGFGRRGYQMGASERAGNARFDPRGANLDGKAAQKVLSTTH